MRIHSFSGGDIRHEDSGRWYWCWRFDKSVWSIELRLRVVRPRRIGIPTHGDPLGQRNEAMRSDYRAYGIIWFRRPSPRLPFHLSLPVLHRMVREDAKSDFDDAFEQECSNLR